MSKKKPKERYIVEYSVTPRNNTRRSTEVLQPIVKTETVEAYEKEENVGSEELIKKINKSLKQKETKTLEKENQILHDLKIVKLTKYPNHDG